MINYKTSHNDSNDNSNANNTTIILLHIFMVAPLPGERKPRWQRPCWQRWPHFLGGCNPRTCHQHTRATRALARPRKSLSRELEPQPSTCNTCMRTDIPVQPVRVDLCQRGFCQRGFRGPDARTVAVWPTSPPTASPTMPLHSGKCHPLGRISKPGAGGNTYVLVEEPTVDINIGA